MVVLNGVVIVVEIGNLLDVRGVDKGEIGIKDEFRFFCFCSLSRDWCFNLFKGKYWRRSKLGNL